MANPGRNALVRLLVVPGLCVVAIVYLKYCGWGGGHYGLDEAHAEHTGQGYRHYVEFGGDPDDVRDDLAELHASARAHAEAVGAPNPAGLNAVLSPLLQRVDNRVRFDGSDLKIDTKSFDAFVATLGSAEDAAPHLPGSLDQELSPEIVSVPSRLRLQNCPDGLSRALAGVTGNDVIVVDDELLPAIDGPLPRLPRVELHVTATASGTAFTAQMSRTVVPGVRLTGYALVIGGDGVPIEVPVDVSPPAQLTFTTMGGLGPFGANSGDMLGGIVQTLCTEVGLAVDKQLVGWAPSLDSLGSDSAGRHAR